MQPLESSPHDSSALINHPLTNRVKLLEWAKLHYRYRTFQKEQAIPTRPGLLYFVHQGMVRITGEAPQKTERNSSEKIKSIPPADETFINLISPGQPFEVVSQQSVQVQAIAHAEDTHIFWLYWEDLDTWPGLRYEVMERFRYQHQRLLLRLNAMGQRHTTDRILLFLRLLIEEHGKVQRDGEFMPCSLTHTHLASAIGTTRVTVTRALGSLKKRGDLLISAEGHLGLPKS
jgi:CRP-like cAMP-binding protein